MDQVCVEGVFVPAPIAAAFARSSNRSKSPFSYTKPFPGAPKPHSYIRVPKVLPIVPAEEMPQPVHLQYNSPMGLYSKEAAEEEFTHQVGAAPVPLPAADKHFDPAKSATLKYLQEGENGNFGQDFADKIAAAETPKVPYNEEPGWARYAREKSERARSRTPGERRHSQGAVTPTQHQYPVHHETARDHAEKTKTYTHAVQPPTTGPAYYQVQHQRGRSPRGMSAGRDFPERGYECGGLDFTKGMHFENAGNQQYYYDQHMSRREQAERARPGFEMGGTDFGKGYVSSGPYHGHGPDPPRLRPHYSADPRSPCNAYTAPNVDAVDANLLVGDTLSNQRIRHEVRNIDQSEYGTSFAPPGGFKRDHVFVKHAPAPAEPVTYCVSAPRTQSLGRSSAPPEQQNVWTQRQSEVDKEVYRTEPNWSRTVGQRRNAWERKAYDTEARVNLPASAKVPPTQPPFWQNRAEKTHDVWQKAADNMNGYSTSHQTQSQTSYQTTQPQSYPANQQSQYSESQMQHSISQHSVPAVYNPSLTQATNIQNLLNSGYNRNQIDYILAHPERYQGGHSFGARSGNQHNKNVEHQYSSSQQAIPLGAPSGGASQQTNYSTETHITGHSPRGYQQQQSQDYYSSQKSTQNQRTSTAVPVQQLGSQNYQSANKSYSTSSNTTSQPVVAPGQQSYSSSHYESKSTTQQPLQVQSAVSPAASYKSYSSSHYSKQEKTSSSTTGGGFPAPQVTTTLPVEQRTRNTFISQSQPSQPAPYNISQSSFTSHSEKTSGGAPIAVAATPAQSSYQSESYNKSHREESHREEVSRPVSQLSQISESRNYKRNYEEKTETTTTPGLAPVTTNYMTSSSKNLSSAKNIDDVFNKKTEMNEQLPHGSISNTHNNTAGGYRDREGHDVSYKRELTTATDPGKDYALLKEEEKRVVETPVEPGVISRHVTTKYYKKKTVTDSTTTTQPE